MSKTEKTITITRERAVWFGSAGKMRVVIDDEFSISLANGESAKIPVSTNKPECTITAHAVGNAGNNIFTIKNLHKVTTINLKTTSSGCSCSIVYDNGLTVDALDKSSGSTTNRIIWWAVMIIFLIIPLVMAIVSSIEYAMFINMLD